MTLPQATDLFEYWETNPPEPELLAILAVAQTTWRPETGPKTPQEHLAQLEALWKSGGAMSPMDMAAMRGLTPIKGKPTQADLGGGIGDFPGM